MKVSARKKNSRHRFAGTYPPSNAASSHGDHATTDPEQFVLETMTALKQIDPDKLTPELREHVIAWVPPRFRCPACLRGGLLSEAIRETDKQWRCPVCHEPVNHDPVS